jgi:hypothetical protein
MHGTDNAWRPNQVFGPVLPAHAKTGLHRMDLRSSLEDGFGGFATAEIKGVPLLSAQVRELCFLEVSSRFTTAYRGRQA